ncbi:inhibitor of Bruton tyrosine kinase isoform X2 [Ischnura elegans]|nr:inhibitor of Bruton tyrosine kinase isoform X2 [Ischnura elegans]XP_046405204.1 inhibitor of Bruton tyrosine kinase isoform X2 [Ischnura elegans]
MGKFHTVFVANDGRAYSCGHGKGRLGLNSEETVMTPKQIVLPSGSEAAKPSYSKHAVTSASVGQDHTLLLSSKGAVFAFGMNAHYQLGLDPPPSVQNTPKLLHYISAPLIGVKAARYHSVAWSKSQIFTWGSNYGQLGHSRDEKCIVLAKVVPNLRSGNFEAVSAGDRVTVIGNARREIYVLQDFACRKIGNICEVPHRIEVVGGRLDPTSIKSEDISGWGDFRSGEDELYILVLGNRKRLLLWSSSSGHFTRCDLHMGVRQIRAADVALGTDKLLVITEQGEGFETDFKIKKKYEEVMASNSKQTTLQRLIEKDKAVDFSLRKISSIHRAISVFCSPKSLNFSIVQLHPNFLTKKPEVERISGLESDLRSLLDEAEESDCICDVVFIVSNVRIPAHRYILEINSPYFSSLILSTEKIQASLSLDTNLEINGNIYQKKSRCIPVKIEGVNPVIFKEILYFIYTGVCSLCVPGKWSVEKDSEYLYFDTLMNGESRLSLNLHNDEGYKVSETVVKEKMAKRRSRNASSSEETESNPVNDARRVAARFKLQALVKELDNMQYDKAKCSIQRKLSMPSIADEKPLPKLSLSPLSCDHLYDVVIECEGAKIMKAHKCILAMRSKYFETMFKGDWIECTGLKNITLPFTHQVMQAIILFLYQNNVPALNKSDDLAYIWSVLITSDQILLEGLKESCEILLVNHITLKNVSEFYQMSDTYNAGKLKQYCMEYVCANLPALLECRALDDIDSELFDDLQLYYWSTRPVVLQRPISVPSKYPDLTTLQSILEAFGMPSEGKYLQQAESILMKEAIETSKKIRAKRKQKGRTTSTDQISGPLSRLSIGSSAGVEIEQGCEKCDSEVVNLDSCAPLDEGMRVSGREESVKEVSIEAKGRSLKGTESLPPECPLVLERAVSPSRDEHFPSLSSDVHQTTGAATSKTPKNRKIMKMSQKERKRQLSASALAVKSSLENGDTPSKAEANPWRRQSGISHEESPTTPVQNLSLVDIMNEEKKRRSSAKKLPFDESSGEENKLQRAEESKLLRPVVWSLSMEGSAGSAPTDVTRGCGWPTSPSAVEDQGVGLITFDEIVADEKKQREMTKKMMEKPLDFTLMEDRAIKELETFYCRAHEHDERISVKRVPSAQVSKPVWHNSKNN